MEILFFSVAMLSKFNDGIIFFSEKSGWKRSLEQANLFKSYDQATQFVQSWFTRYNNYIILDVSLLVEYGIPYAYYKSKTNKHLDVENISNIDLEDLDIFLKEGNEQISIFNTNVEATNVMDF